MKRLKHIIISFIIIFLFISIFNVYSAIVSDNDGSAFVTKSEFESLKDSFNNQIDNYNKSIDSKIDGAIASYLAGLKLAYVSTTDSYIYKANSKKELVFVGDYKLPTTQIGGHSKLAAQFVFKRDASIMLGYGSVPSAGYVNNQGNYYFGINHLVIKIGWYGGTGSSSWPADAIDVREYNGNANQKNIVYKVATSSTVENYYYTDSDNCYDLVPRLSLTSMTLGGGYQRICIINGTPLTWAFGSGTSFADYSGKDFGYKESTLHWYLDDYCDIYSMTYPNTKNITYDAACSNILSCEEAVYNTTNNKYIDYLAGNKINESSYIYAVHENDWNKCADTPMVEFDSNWQNYIQYYYFSDDNPNGAATLRSDGSMNSSAASIGLPNVSIWMKKNSRIPIINLVHHQWTQAVGKTIHYYSGIPICSSDSAQHIKVVLKFKNSSTTETAQFSVRDTEFTNTNIESTNVTLYKNGSYNEEFTDFTINAGTDEQTVTFYIEAKKDKTYWLKVCPSGDNTVKVTSQEQFVTYIDS